MAPPVAPQAGQHPSPSCCLGWSPGPASSPPLCIRPRPAPSPGSLPGLPEATHQCTSDIPAHPDTGPSTCSPFPPLPNSYFSSRPQPAVPSSGASLMAPPLCARLPPPSPQPSVLLWSVVIRPPLPLLTGHPHRTVTPRAEASGGWGVVPMPGPVTALVLFPAILSPTCMLQPCSSHLSALPPHTEACTLQDPIPNVTSRSPYALTAHTNLSFPIFQSALVTTVLAHLVWARLDYPMNWELL